ncbi:glycosyl transferase [Vulcanisaeta souniana JCM 11219]|nr:glycosyl transferase [Vulcanisaeta souniana JCM 11219]
MGFIDVALRSLGSFLNLDFDGYELVVDNASSDGSFERIKKFIEEKRPGGVRVKVVRNERNLGYAGGMNVGWEARDPDSKYVAFVNNDLIPTPQSLTKLIEYMEGDEKIAATNGLIKYPDGKTIYAAGWAVDDILTGIGVCNGRGLADCSTVDKPHLVTYADGSYMVVRVSAIKAVGFDGKPFINETFLYADDALLGIRLWNLGYSSYYVPVEAGIHHASLTTKSTGFIRYYPIRAKFIMYAMIRTSHNNVLPIYHARIKWSSWLLCNAGLGQYCTMYKAVTDGWELGMRFRNRYGFLDLNKAPHIKLPTYVVMAHVFFPIRSTFLRNRFVTHDDLMLDELG